MDIAVPTNNKSIHSIGLAWWFLAREVLRLRGTISREVPWEVMVDLYFYRDPEEVCLLTFFISQWVYRDYCDTKNCLSRKCVVKFQDFSLGFCKISHGCY